MVTISITQLLLALLIIAAIVFVIYLTILIAKAIPCIEAWRIVLQEVQEILEKVKVTGSDAKDAINTISNAIKGKGNLFSMLSNFVNGFNSAKQLLTKKKKS